jgi:cytochrome bd-type quinol oxidase subunit 2
MHLSDLWFIAIAVLWAGYFVLEGFDFGVGILLPFLSRGDDTAKRVMINTIGPVWDGNEVWLLTAGGATFAAFPAWYAAMFSAFYLPLLIILVALIIRGVAFEYRGKRDGGRWRRGWDTCIFLGSLVPALLWGVAFGNIVRGIPLAALAAACLIGAALANRAGREGVAFAANAVAILAAVATLFTALYPRVLPSTTSPAFSLTTANAASAAKTLAIMTVVACIFLPLVLAYQGWTYWVFRRRVSAPPSAAASAKPPSGPPPAPRTAPGAP